MNEQKILQELSNAGYDHVWIYEAPPGEVDEEHSHEYDTRLFILKGDIQIVSEMRGVVMNMQYKAGQHVEIPRRKLHSGKVGDEGCRYVVAEKH